MELQEPLNRAHRYQRQAERDILSRRFTEALLHFQLAGEYYGKTVADLSSSTNSGRNLSLQILLEQKKFCLHQVEILCLKLKQLEQQENLSLENFKNRAPSILISNLDIEEKRGSFYNGDKSMTKRPNMINHELKTTIFQKLDEHDTLLGDLLKKSTDNDDNAKTDDLHKNNVGAIVQPKDDRLVIEELRQLNDELRGFIIQLLEELETKTREIEILKSERDNLRRSSSSIPTVIIGPDNNIVDNNDLPELAPLEIPTYTINQGP